uniref:Uncharacterized protein n=1 Tax=Arundo donax TaxID=35708 RepID=A0A0A8ZGA3_ARUDO
MTWYRKFNSFISLNQGIMVERSTA